MMRTDTQNSTLGDELRETNGVNSSPNHSASAPNENTHIIPALRPQLEVTLVHSIERRDLNLEQQAWTGYTLGSDIQSPDIDHSQGLDQSPEGFVDRSTRTTMSSFRSKDERLAITDTEELDDEDMVDNITRTSSPSVFTQTDSLKDNRSETFRVGNADMNDNTTKTSTIPPPSKANTSPLLSGPVPREIPPPPSIKLGPAAGRYYYCVITGVFANMRLSAPLPNFLPQAVVGDDDYTRRYPVDDRGEEMGANARVWKTYIDESEIAEKEYISDNNATLDGILIFVSLITSS